MNHWILIAVLAAVLYGLWLMLDFTFTMIDRAHELRRDEEERRRGAVKPERGMVNCDTHGH